MNATDSQHQIKELLNLLRIEQAYEREQHRQLLEETPLNQRVAKGISLFPLDLKQQDVGLGGRPVLEFGSSQNLSAFQPGQTVSLFSLVAGQSEQVSAVVQRVGENWLKIYLNAPEAPEWLEDGKLGLDLYYDETTWKAMYFALEKLLKSDDSRLKALTEMLLGAAPARFLNDLRQVTLAGFNPSQQQAITRVLAAEDLALIHGPPGTGKTTTLVASIEAVVQTEKQVLVCAPSNTAVDLLTRAIAAKGRRVIRLGHPARMQEDVWPFTLDEQAANHPNAAVLKRLRREMLQLRKQAAKFRRNFGPAEREERRQLYAQARVLGRELAALEAQITSTLLDQAEVICATLVGSDQYVLRGRSFGTVFIDEAAQALEGACWIPILKAKKIVMAGDHCQLPPTIKSPEAKALGVTLFEKAIAAQPGAAVLLEIQYRMHETIMGFSSLQFYQGRLQADASVARHVLNPQMSPEHPLNQPLEWVDTSGCGFEEVLDPQTQSYANPEEGRLLAIHLQQLLDDPDFPASPVSIGVIAPYRQQVEWLKLNLKPVLPAQVTLQVETVDSFQGQELDIIYMSFVRSNNDGEIGFLRDLRRSNVAITRARKKLVLIGDSSTLSNHPFYRDLHEYVEAYGQWRSGWEYAGSW
ncbi:MAG: AAA domain-containing protein [Candidatus Sericytochromatia bacterium]